MVLVADEVQPGTRIDAAVWDRFRENVRDRKGQVRGHLRTELERAIQQYCDDNTDPELSRIEAKVDHLAAELGTDVSGVAPDSSGGKTHTRAPPDERPPPNAPTGEKVRWLAECVLERESATDREFREVSRNALREVVKAEYGFRRDTAKRYVAELVDHFGLVEHPNAGSAVLVTESRYEEIIEQRREQARAESEAKL